MMLHTHFQSATLHLERPLHALTSNYASLSEDVTKIWIIADITQSHCDNTAFLLQSVWTRQGRVWRCGQCALYCKKAAGVDAMHAATGAFLSVQSTSAPLG